MIKVWRYGVENVFQLDEVKNNIDKDKRKEKARKTHELNKNWVSLNLLSEFEKYKRKVLSETRKHLRELWNDWDGTDFYTGKKLITNEEYKIKFPNKHLNTNKKQPSIDHKVSILVGFIENISPQIIGNINNITITSRQINSKKNVLRDKEFLEMIKGE